jgi:hypothetical protein
VAVYFEGPVEGTANDDDGDMLDEVVTEMIELNLTGFSPTLGPIHVGLNPSIPTIGEIEEMQNSTLGTLDVPPFTFGGTASSFFNFFLQIEVAGMTFHTTYPMYMSAQITHKPPAFGECFAGQTTIPLITQYGYPIGFYVGGRSYCPNACNNCGNFNDISVIDLTDLDEFSHNWLWTVSGMDLYNLADLDCDGEVSFPDFAIFAGQWLETCP